MELADWRRRLRYRVDNSLAKGVSVVLLWVGIALLALVVLVGTLMWVIGIGPSDQPVPLIENLWESLTRSLDPGTFGADEGTAFRIAGLIVTIGGLLAVSLVIGLVSNAVDTRLDSLRRGRSVVVESGHTLVLGYSSKLGIVVRELMQASESTSDHAVVLLTPEDKVDLEDRLRRELPNHLHSRLVVRRGTPSSIHDLTQVDPARARSIIILRPDTDTADAEVVRVALAVRQIRSAETDAIPVVAELEDPAVAEALRQALPGGIVTVVSRDIIGRIAAQTSRAAGMGIIYQDLLDFDGDEFYTSAPPSHLVGRTFFDGLFSSRNCTLVGIVAADGSVELCPPMDRVIAATDHLVLIANDDSTISFLGNDSMARAHTLQASTHTPLPHQVERTLIIGWNRYAERILEELDAHALPGSSLYVMIDTATSEGFSEGFLRSLRNYTFAVSAGSITDVHEVSASMQNGPFDHILILCAHDHLAAVDADARALLALMHVRNYLNQHPEAGHSGLNLVSEMLTTESVELAQIAQPDDFIVSQRLVSLYIAQLAENPERQGAIDQLLDSQGPQLALTPISNFLNDGDHSFEDLVAAAANAGDVAIGWRAPGSSGSGLPGGIRLNPAKDARLHATSTIQAIVLTNR